MLPQEIIRKKRNGQRLSKQEISLFVEGITDGSITEGQIGAFGMAIFFQGMSMPERIALTQSMMQSGDVLRWSKASLNGPVVDKHSSGGVGDKVSLMLAPIVAACGAHVPMISGRGLGHTGGTLDKFDSIPGYNTTPDEATFKAVTKDVGCAIIGQTSNLAPADKRFYGIRDVTATVESIPLITASILSKKLAAGLDGLAMDIKCGNGAFCETYEAAHELAQSIVNVANGAGVATRALITDMNQVLGWTAGNALEMLEAVAYLKDPASREPRLHRVVMDLAADMLMVGKLAASREEGREKALQALTSGRAAEIFARMVSALGGPTDFIENPESYLPEAPVTRIVLPPKSGYLTAQNARGIGIAVVELGGGRKRADDSVDHAVGLSACAAIGERLEMDEPIAIIHARDDVSAELCERALLSHMTIGDEAPKTDPAIYEAIRG